MTRAPGFYDVLDTPVGPIFIGGSDEGIHRLDFLADGRLDSGRMALDLEACIARLGQIVGADVEQDQGRAAEAAGQLREYFAGRRTHFDLPLAPRGTAFQQRVWAALAEIPHGGTSSYGEIAARIGRPSASRAVGAANGQNPLVVVVPCHRVVGSSGALTGYGGGIARKQWLLEHEAQQLRLFARAS